MKIAALAGDGIGPEIVAQALKVLRALARDGLRIEIEEAPFGGAGYDAYGDPLPESTLKLAREADSVLCGAVGGPKYDALPRPQRPEQGILRIRKALGLFANLRPALLYPELIGASTLNEYRKYIEKDGALERRFQPVIVEPPAVEETVAILKGLRGSYEAHHRVVIPDEALEHAAKLADRYITDRFLPDKAIDVIDEAGARARIASQVPPPEVEELKTQLAEIAARKEQAIGDQDVKVAAEYPLAGTESKSVVLKIWPKHRPER